MTKTAVRPISELAIRSKLEAQAEFVFWWDTHADKDKGGRPSKTRNRSVTGLQAGDPKKKRDGSVTLLAGKKGLPDRKNQDNGSCHLEKVSR